MSDPFLASMLVHIVNVYHMDSSAEGDGQQVEGWPDRWHPDILNLACLITMDGREMRESPVGYLIESDAIMYCEAADVRERDRIHFGDRVLYVNGTPIEHPNPWGTTPMTPHLMVVGLREDKAVPA